MGRGGRLAGQANPRPERGLGKLVLDGCSVIGHTVSNAGAAGPQGRTASGDHLGIIGEILCNYSGLIAGIAAAVFTSKKIATSGWTLIIRRGKLPSCLNRRSFKAAASLGPTSLILHD